MSSIYNFLTNRKPDYTPESDCEQDDQEYSDFNFPNPKIEKLQKEFDSFHLGLNNEQKEIALKKSAFLKTSLECNEETAYKVAAKTILAKESSTGFTRLSKHETKSKISIAIKDDQVYLHHPQYVGKGNFKKALKGERLSQDGLPLPVMRLKTLKDSKEKKIVEKTEKEALLQKSLDHPHIVKVYDYNKYLNKADQEQVEIYMEVCDTSLEKADLTTQETLQVMTDIASALDYLHQQNLVHNDLKDDNIFISGKRGKLGDFGKCRKVGETCGRFKSIIPPELQNTTNGPSTPQVDVYQFGLLLHSRFEAKEGPMRKLTDACLDKDPKNRPSMHEVHQILKELNNKK